LFDVVCSWLLNLLAADGIAWVYGSSSFLFWFS